MIVLLAHTDVGNKALSRTTAKAVSDEAQEQLRYRYLSYVLLRRMRSTLRVLVGRTRPKRSTQKTAIIAAEGLTAKEKFTAL